MKKVFLLLTMSTTLLQCMEQRPSLEHETTQQIQILAQSLFSRNDSFDKMILEAAMRKDCSNLLKLLLEIGVNPNTQNQITGYTPLHIAAHYGQGENVAVLLKYKADYNMLAKCNASPLSIAIEQGKPKIVLMLLEAGSNPNIKDSDENTPLMLCLTTTISCALRSKAKCKKMAAYLCQYGADLDPYMLNRKGQTLNDLVQRKGFSDINTWIETREEIDKCCICLKGFKLDSSYYITNTNCGHKFHRICLNNWKAKDETQTCPLCRSTLEL